MKDILKKFEEYLTDIAGVSTKSLKFYRSDYNHFKAWLTLKVRTLGVFAEYFGQLIPFINSTIAKEYKSYLQDNNIATKTINRRLSTLRALSRFLLSERLTNQDFMDGETNIKSTSIGTVDPSVVDKFAQFLANEKVSQNTSKNYISDIKQFINWVKTSPQLENTK